MENLSIKNISNSRLIDKVCAASYYINEEFKHYSCESAEDKFMNGWCAYYAKMLYELFKGKSEYYISYGLSLHAICKIGDAFYDVLGVKFNKQGTDVAHTAEELKIKYEKRNEEEFLYFLDVLNTDKRESEIAHMEISCEEIMKKIIKIMDFEYSDDDSLNIDEPLALKKILKK